jgi:hypothetical protein
MQHGSKRLDLITSLPFDSSLYEMAADTRHSFVKEVIERALNVIEDEEGGPDNREALDLKSALAAFDAGMYIAAITFIERALMPVPERRSFAGPPGNAMAMMQELRAQLFSARKPA